MLQAELSSDTDYMVMNLKYLLLGPLQEKKKKKNLADSWIRYSFIGPLGSRNTQGPKIGCPSYLKYSSFRYEHNSLPYLLLGLESNATFLLRPTLVILLKMEICQPYIPFQLPFPFSIFFS